RRGVSRTALDALPGKASSELEDSLAKVPGATSSLATFREEPPAGEPTAAEDNDKDSSGQDAGFWQEAAPANEASQAIAKAPLSAHEAAMAQPPELGGRPTFRQELRWVLLAFVPSSLMLGATTFMTTDIASLPLFWTIPLDLYLLSFILVFSRLPKWVHRLMVLSMPVAVLLLTFMIVQDLKPERSVLGIPPILVVFFIHLATLFIIAMVCHGELAQGRPATPYLTRYFLCMSIGGVLGGAFNALIAPAVFDSV